VRTFGEWAEVAAGSLQADLVAHCGESTLGFYLNTLVAVDVATSWTECRAVWGKGQERVGTAVHHVRQALPFPLRELHTDNGSEFLNEVLYPWCRREGIRFTRGRPYKKNDQAYVEQKNWSVPRRLIGYDRYSSKAALQALEELYRPLCEYVNFFQPVRKLVAKERDGAKVRKRFDRAQTPYQRLLAAGVLGGEERQKLERLYGRLNPVRLQREIAERLEALWNQAEEDGPLKAVEKPAKRVKEDLACG
jgi:transposase InsO family protein